MRATHNYEKDIITYVPVAYNGTGTNNKVVPKGSSELRTRKSYGY